MPRRHAAQVPQPIPRCTATRSPERKVSTPGPTSSTTPAGSWPVMQVPGVTPGSTALP